MGRPGPMDDQSLRSRLIRLAQQQPGLRPHLLPLLRDASAPLPGSAPRAASDHGMENYDWDWDEAFVHWYDDLYVGEKLAGQMDSLFDSVKHDPADLQRKAPEMFRLSREIRWRRTKLPMA